jgi:hypothetical protein
MIRRQKCRIQVETVCQKLLILSRGGDLTTVQAYDHNDPNSTNARSHPWNVAEHDSTHRYYNFRENIGLIRSSLEDFKPWEHYPAIDSFYNLLEWLNGPDSVFESNDCAFSGPMANTNARFAQRLQCSGRLMILYRDLKLNTSAEHIRWFKDASQYYISKADPNFVLGVVGTTLMQVTFVTLHPEEKQSGQELQLSFWAWGDSEIETFTNLERVFQNIHISLRAISDEIRESMTS